LTAPFTVHRVTYDQEATVSRTFPAIAIVSLTALLAASGCGGDDSSGSGGAYGSGSEGGSTQAAKSETSGSGKASGTSDGVVAVADNGKLGAILVDSGGFTLYDFHKDKGGKSACYGACAATWPPLTTSGKPQATKGAMASKLGTTKRNDGTLQVTYAGLPLYTYVADAKPGDANGQDIESFGAEWYALQPSGAEAKD
jgi:predicted lipoprotein with Yx(FWY)xxD motif